MRTNKNMQVSARRLAPALALDQMKAEITAQLIEMKRQLNKEIIEDLQAMQVDIYNKLARDVDQMVAREVAHQLQTAVAPGGTIDEKLNKHSSAIVEINSRQIVAARQSTRDLVNSVGQEICNTVYGQVIGELNEKIIPQVNNMVQWVNFKLEDGNATVDAYRRAVEHQSNHESLKLITDGRADERILSEHVRTFFSEND